MKTVLLVDDSPTILMSVKGVLQRNGLNVETAKTGEEALDKIKGGVKPDLMITDLNMPGINGIELIQKARQGGLKFTPMLVLTTESQESKRQEARAAGATGWLVKPVQGDQLMQVIKKVLPGA
ncbi:two-component system, chemotaxis family, response regulator CheY [Marinospirillum celere]|uniref:Two-component system, chemotaxis family, response regulator CheY n=1 Tax=Marinospirillum celere TaxID=1122252 RepID=A0A1I1FNJ5_9GAMM|nr:response regulator [Marinospirillum celere]SFC00566.1 two-component system, chemotaxis family, response regulator CheY [Marinospirillum celere]